MSSLDDADGLSSCLREGVILAGTASSDDAEPALRDRSRFLSLLDVTVGISGNSVVGMDMRLCDILELVEGMAWPVLITVSRCSN